MRLFIVLQLKTANCKICVEAFEQTLAELHC